MEFENPVVWIKAKYAAPKQRGRYAGGTNAAPLKKRGKKQSGSKPPMTRQRVMVLEPTKGKITWIWRTV